MKVNKKNKNQYVVLINQNYEMTKLQFSIFSLLSFEFRIALKPVNFTHTSFYFHVMHWTIEFGSCTPECTYSLYTYNQRLVIEHDLCVLPWVMDFNPLLKALWNFTKTPYIELIIINWKINSWNVYGMYTAIGFCSRGWQPR